MTPHQETSSDSDDEEYVMAVRDFQKFFRRRGKFVRQPYDDKKNFRKVKEDKKEKNNRRCFKCGDQNQFISDCPKHSFNDQKAFVVECWSDSGDDFKKEEICLMALDNNEVLSDTPYYSNSSLDNESWENKYCAGGGWTNRRVTRVIRGTVANTRFRGTRYEVLEGIRSKKWLVDLAVKSWRT
nr:zf-CCHC domain-containing protein/DUF4219 domain-containing protein/UBN2 domain-containing protein [Tanacetum cinerariifolium]